MSLNFLSNLLPNNGKKDDAAAAGEAVQTKENAAEVAQTDEANVAAENEVEAGNNSSPNDNQESEAEVEDKANTNKKNNKQKQDEKAKKCCVCMALVTKNKCPNCGRVYL